MSRTERDDLIVGAFYWVMPANDPDLVEAWEFYTQPARFHGRDAVTGELRWQYIGVEGPSTWSARFIGPRIVSPEGEDERISKGNDPPDF